MLVYLLVALALTFAIAAVVIGREARRLDAEPPRPVFDPDEAVEWVANHLPFEIGAELSHEDVRRIIGWNLEFFRSKGLSGNGSSLHTEAPLVIGGAETVAYVLHKASEAGADYRPDHVQAVLEAQMSYLEAIGAIGPAVPPDDL